MWSRGISSIGRFVSGSGEFKKFSNGLNERDLIILDFRFLETGFWRRGAFE